MSGMDSLPRVSGVRLDGAGAEGWRANPAGNPPQHSKQALPCVPGFVFVLGMEEDVGQLKLRSL